MAEQKSTADQATAPAKPMAHQELSPSPELLSFTPPTDPDPVFEAARLYERAVMAFCRVAAADLEVWP